MNCTENNDFGCAWVEFTRNRNNRRGSFGTVVNTPSRFSVSIAQEFAALGPMNCCIMECEKTDVHDIKMHPIVDHYCICISIFQQSGNRVAYIPFRFLQSVRGYTAGEGKGLVTLSCMTCANGICYYVIANV